MSQMIYLRYFYQIILNHKLLILYHVLLQVLIVNDENYYWILGNMNFGFQNKGRFP